MKHKWHDEIVAWAGGAEIEVKHQGYEWEKADNLIYIDNNKVQYRIKPQPKEPKYLHLILQPNDSILLRTQPVLCGEEIYYGKIEVQND